MEKVTDTGGGCHAKCYSLYSGKLCPTESPVISLQQLGRGLRRAKNKRYLHCRHLLTMEEQKVYKMQVFVSFPTEDGMRTEATILRISTMVLLTSISGRL